MARWMRSAGLVAALGMVGLLAGSASALGASVRPAVACVAAWNSHGNASWRSAVVELHAAAALVSAGDPVSSSARTRTVTCVLQLWVAPAKGPASFVLVAGRGGPRGIRYGAPPSARVLEEQASEHRRALRGPSNARVRASGALEYHRAMRRVVGRSPLRKGPPATPAAPRLIPVIQVA